MRIGIDARELCGHVTGVGRYLGGLLTEWAAAPETSAHEFVLYAPGPIAFPFDRRRFPTRLVSGAPGTWWEQVRLPATAKGDHLDVFFAPAYTAPLRLGVPFVVTIHDISFVAHPQWFRMREGLRRRWLTRRSAAQAHAIVTVSEFTRHELVERLSIPEARIHVIPHGVKKSVSLQPLASSLRSPRVLYVGSIFNRRHVPDLVRAFAPIARRVPDAALDIVGDNRTYPREDLAATIAAEGLGDRVHLHEYVADGELAALYSSASAFAFLSEYEGFGLTPIEALSSGVPSVLLDTPVARETCGGAALYVPLGDLRATTAALEQLLFDEATRARLLAAAPSVLGRYKWSQAARETMDVLEHAAHDG